MAPQLPSQLAPGMASFNQGFKSVGDLMNQIKQHQFERQKLMEAVRQHGEMMGFKQREEGRAQNKENRAQQSFDQKNAIMQELANWYQNKGGNQNQSMGGNTARPAAPNVAPSGMPANEQNAMMNDPNTGVKGGEHEVDMNGQPVGGQQMQVPQVQGQAQQYGMDGAIPQSNQPPEELQQRYMLAFGKALPKTPQSPESKEAAALDLFNKKEEIKRKNKAGSGEVLTDKTKSKYQSVIGGATTALPIIDKIIEETKKGNVPGQAIGAWWKRNQQASYKGEISTLLDGIRNSYTIPNTDSGTAKAEDKVLRKPGESDDNYISRLETIRKQIVDRGADAKAKLHAGNITATAENTVTLFKNGMPHDVPESGVEDAITNWGYSRG